METPAEYHVTPPLLRPLNEAENRQNKQLNDALTQAKIALGDRHAELRMMRVAVDVLTTRALKAEGELEYERQMREQNEKAMLTLAGRVKEQQAELGSQEVEKLALVLEVQALRNANFKLEHAARRPA